MDALLIVIPITMALHTLDKNLNLFSDTSTYTSALD